jgi:hypothetical protein
MSAAACPSGTVLCHNPHAQRTSAKGRKQPNNKQTAPSAVEQVK